MLPVGPASPSMDVYAVRERPVQQLVAHPGVVVADRMALAAEAGAHEPARAVGRVRRERRLGAASGDDEPLPAPWNDDHHFDESSRRAVE